MAEVLGVAAKTLQRNLSKRLNARRYKKPKGKAISDVNKGVRTAYGEEHRGKTIIEWWQWVYFTDEVHFNSKELADKQEYELRVPGQSQRLKSIQEVQGAPLDVTVHVTAGISYNQKGIFEFYSDPAEPAAKGVYRPRKPRKSSVQTPEELATVREAWEVAQRGGGLDADIKIKGNSMTQKYYTKYILPKHIERLKALEAQYDHVFYLQEDGDPSHGTRSWNNLAAQAKRAAGISILPHPAQSPDLNPIEAIWQLIKQRLRGGNWQTVEEFKGAILREWRRITQQQIRSRISEMRWRCKEVVQLEGNRIRSSLW
ncbi:hypothetical protein P152DRAFT_458805 [Eremomyces bilateralis CBS 781.70]|uniref:Tc1-like transposase DDE domain-containing protein n=1 Tax=Eremomyces bilateralis CBS 781.70 TaxID=1392243 RepID=A0A6G1G3N6_9PEZI|nr:uncharacterized protein P152DRAFT_458805 [Eremomyces bilateralis CBS 781.70]KAF1812429.1 hypothetical protein P152DRAFT_458805 [Eremomyces bilateralis CBS 781.70]